MWEERYYLRYGKRSFELIFMSRIGKQPIAIPAGVVVTEKDGTMTIEGPLGALSFRLPSGIHVMNENGTLRVRPNEEKEELSHQSRALWGTSRAIIAHMVAGVTKGFEKRLQVEGIGYRVALEGATLVFALGFSHSVRFPAPDGITFKVEKNGIIVSGASKELVGQTASALRALRPPEPYKGKGIRYAEEIIRKKAGKKAVGTV
jgi:large subunit ribosomal protein L6